MSVLGVRRNIRVMTTDFGWFIGSGNGNAWTGHTKGEENVAFEESCETNYATYEQLS